MQKLLSESDFKKEKVFHAHDLHILHLTILETILFKLSTIYAQ